MVDLSGELARHMALHILAMNLLAPALAYGWFRARDQNGPPPVGPFAAAGLQIAFLWGWHVPAAMEAAASAPLIGMAMHVSLFLSALLFWQAIIGNVERPPWHAVAAMLVTGKLFCLLGILLVFAPRTLYGPVMLHTGMPAGSGLADQQTAGMIMVIACPLTYVLGSIVIVRRWFMAEERANGWRLGRPEP
ncbi:cytochrome c oxidase assembly protein [Nitratireductor sp. ZSWI3]|uniref:cytochrome c oxidase assembly protein n=1 Tax=Nitratireductor sp. ZSWI3 TaxID=2966359 RepID=UPI00214F91AA|nr:cytochrome c oxidase assembly protein [Nitratireductor sp. ZSWI3]MCR4264678.1 cytochrome c oxidase assembly protein [Nitratireductor sp. ZSWI3]